MKSEEYNVEEIEINFNKYLVILRRRWWIILLTCFFCLDLALLLAILRKPVYQSGATLLFESARQASSLIGLEDAPQDVKSLSVRDDPLDTQLEILRSIPVAEQTINRLGLSDPTGNPLKPDAFLSNLETEGIPGTDVIKISYTADSPDLAKEVVDAVMNVFIAQNVSANRAAAVSAQKFIENQLPLSEVKVNKAETSLKEFKETYDIVDLEKESERIVSTLSTLEDNLTQLQGQAANLNSQSTKIQNRLQLNTDQAYESGIISQSPAVDEALTRLRTAESELAASLSRYEENNPVIIDLRSEIASLEVLLNQRVDESLKSNDLLSSSPSSNKGKSIKQNLIEKSLQIETEQAGLFKQIQALSLAKSKYQQRAKALPNIEKGYRDLERKLNAANATYKRLLESLQEAKVLQNQSIGNARVISPAQKPVKPAGLSKNVYLLGGGFLGLVLGIVLAFLADLADQVNSIKEIQQLYDYPLLGIIRDPYDMAALDKTFLEPPTQLSLSTLSPRINLNAYAELLAALKSRYGETFPKTIGITSAIEGEGKSSITSGFAVALAQFGYTVLIIDANFRKPFQHHIWNVSNLLGISDVITYQIPLQEAIQKVESRIDILPVGTVPQKAGSSLRDGTLSDITNECQLSYDVILVDAPSAIDKFNATLMSSMMSLLLVVQPDLIKKSDISKAKKLLSKNDHTNILGLVANRTIRQDIFGSTQVPIDEEHLLMRAMKEKKKSLT